MREVDFIDWLSERLDRRERHTVRYVSISEELVDAIVDEIKDREGKEIEVAESWYEYGRDDGNDIFASKSDAEDFYDSYEGDIWEALYLIGRDKGYFDSIDYLADVIEERIEDRTFWLRRFGKIKTYRDVKVALALLVSMDIAGYYWEYLKWRQGLKKSENKRFLR